MKESVIAILPEIILVVGASLVLFLPSRRERTSISPWLAIIFIFGALFLNSFTSFQGYYFRDHIIIDTAGVLARFIVYLLGALVVFGSISDYSDFYLENVHYSLLLFSLAGGGILCVANHFVTIILALELLTIPTYALVAERKFSISIEGAMKYFLFGLAFLAIMLYGFSFFVGAFLSRGAAVSGGLLITGLLLFLSGFSFKVTLFPFHFWAPDAYESSSPQVAGYLATASKVAAFIALFRIIVHYSEIGGSPLALSLYLLAVASMTFGNLAALVQDNVKRILAYSGVVHAGYLLIPLVALEWNNPLVKSSFLFYLLVYTLANLGAFLVIAAIDERGELRSFRGLSKESPFLAAAMTVFLLSLGGFPPLAGFFGKLYLFSAAVSNGQIVLAIIGVVNSVISFGYYLKVVREMYLEEGEAEIAFPSPWLYGALYFLLFVILFIPLYQTDLLILSGLF